MNEQFFGNEKNLMSNNRFRLMAFFFALRDAVYPYGRKIELFGIKKGDVVVDCGCGTGSCLKTASELVGEKGTVYASDIHDLAIACASRIAEKYPNVKPITSSVSSIPLPDSAADCVYALDMFHMVSDTDSFLKELCRITRKNGRLIIEDGHQPRSQAKSKILRSGVWKITEENRGWMVCVPLM